MSLVLPDAVPRDLDELARRRRRFGNPAAALCDLYSHVLRRGDGVHPLTSLSNSGIVSIPAGFLGAILTARDVRSEERFDRLRL